MANMVLGMLILKKRYTFTKYLSVVMISVGIATCTIMSARDVKGSADTQSSNASSSSSAAGQNGAKEVADGDDENWEMLRWLVGISMLTFALFMSARMGIYQEVIYKKHGKHPKEALFYSVSKSFKLQKLNLKRFKLNHIGIFSLLYL